MIMQWHSCEFSSFCGIPLSLTARARKEAKEGSGDSASPATPAMPSQGTLIQRSLAHLICQGAHSPEGESTENARQNE